MNSDEAKKILVLYRASGGDAAEEQVPLALDQLTRDPELRRWLEQTSRFHEAMRAQFQQIPVPPGLRESILARRRIIRPLWWQQPVWIAAAAVIVLLLSLSAFWLQPPRAKDRFSDYRSRMVRGALRQYRRMDVMTNDLKAVQQFMGRRGAPAEFTLAKGLEQLPITGGVVTRWRGNAVSMVCFDRGDKQMLFLFVLDRSAFKDAPPAAGQAQVEKVNRLLTSSWSEGDKTYILAGPEDTELLRKSP